MWRGTSPPPPRRSGPFRSSGIRPTRSTMLPEWSSTSSTAMVPLTFPGTMLATGRQLLQRGFVVAPQRVAMRAAERQQADRAAPYRFPQRFRADVAEFARGDVREHDRIVRRVAARRRRERLGRDHLGPDAAGAQLGRDRARFGARHEHLRLALHADGRGKRVVLGDLVAGDRRRRLRRSPSRAFAGAASASA